MIALAHETGGIAILAHPDLIDEMVETKDGKMIRAEYIDGLIEAALMALKRLTLTIKKPIMGQ